MADYTFNSETKFSNFIKYLKEQVFIEKLLEDNNPDEIDVFKSIINKTECYSIAKFAECIESEDSIRLLSAHSSKGLEYKVVIIPDLEDGRYPSYKSFNNNEKLEEERRLLFVATTRAKDYLCISYSGFYISNGRKCHNGSSRYFNEIKSMFTDADNFT